MLRYFPTEINTSEALPTHRWSETILLSPFRTIGKATTVIKKDSEQPMQWRKTIVQPALPSPLVKPVTEIANTAIV